MTPTRLDPPRSVGLLAVAVSNLLPLVGVLHWGWNVRSLLALYWFEGLGTALFAAAKALFAERASLSASRRMQPLGELCEKRGGVRVRSGWPTAYVRNVPFVLGILGVMGGVLSLLGGYLALRLSVTVSTLSAPPVLAGSLGLVLARAVEFRTDYLGGGEYADVSARMVAATPARQAVLLFFLLPFGNAGPAAGPALLAAVVAAKLLAETYGYYVEHAEESPGRLGTWLTGPRGTSEPPPEVDLPEAEPTARIRTDTRSVLLGAVGAAAAGLAGRVGYVSLVFLVMGAFALGPVVVAVAATAVCLVVAAKGASHYLRFGTLEYQRRGGTVVAYDAVLEEPQWTVPVSAVDEAATVNLVADRLLGTATFGLSTDDSGAGSTRRLGPVAEGRRAVDAFSLPVESVSRPEANRTVVAVAFALAACFLAVPVGLYAIPDVTTGEAVLVTVMLGPFFAFVVGLLFVSGLSGV